MKLTISKTPVTKAKCKMRFLGFLIDIQSLKIYKKKPYINKLLAKLKRDINFQGAKTSLKTIIKNLGKIVTNSYRED